MGGGGRGRGWRHSEMEAAVGESLDGLQEE